jgi:sugar phosphate isomerase/epimerase
MPSRSLIPEFTRRSLLLAGASGSLATLAKQSQLAVEAYIFQQYAARQKKALGDVLDEVIPMARNAGFRHIELNQEFFTPPVRDRVLRLLRANELTMPSVYVGGPMHDPALAESTIEHALAIAGICKPFGCMAVVHNPDPKPQGERKGDQELRVEVESLNRMGWKLSRNGFQLRVHHHTPEMLENAREWRYILRNTDPKNVALCMDLDWVRQGDQDPLALLREAGSRVAEIHLRNSRHKLWMESLAYGDIDYGKVAAYLRDASLIPLLVVELAYRENTIVTRPLLEDLHLSRIYAEQTFGVSAAA